MGSNPTPSAICATMISKLTGIISDREENSVIIDIHGVGYEVLLSKKNIQFLQSSSETVTLYIAHIFKQEEQLLCGFLTPQEKTWFRLLTTVQGVGTKVALAILSALSLQDLENAVLYQDPNPIKQADGVGLKVANRIILELKNKIPHISLEEHAVLSTQESPINTPHKNINDAVQALVQLGYMKNKALQVIKQITQENSDLSESELIKMALQKISM